MMVFYGGIALALALVVGLMIGLSKLNVNKGLSLAISLVAGGIVFVAIAAGSTIKVLGPGELGRAYGVLGGEKALKVGYNFVAPWERTYIWDMRSETMNFTEGEAADDAFGAQTKTGDYLTAIANITVRIDPDRLDEYILRFGSETVARNHKISTILKNELKRAMENALKEYETRDLMNNKAQAADEARTIALDYLSDLPFVVETLWFVDFEASAEYEAAIREQADMRMKTEKAALQESLNAQEAKNNKVKADGEAEVQKIAAQAEAAANEIRAQNEAQVAKIAAERDAEVKRVEADAEAKATTTRAQADAAARVAKDTAEAQGAEAIGKAYKANPELMQIKRIELEGAWAKAWNGMMPQFQGMESFNFADFSEIIKGFMSAGGQ